MRFEERLNELEDRMLVIETKVDSIRWWLKIIVILLAVSSNLGEGNVLHWIQLLLGSSSGSLPPPPRMKMSNFTCTL